MNERPRFPLSAPVPDGRAEPFRIGCWTVSTADGTLTARGAIRRLEPRQMQVLECLVRHAGNVVPHQRLLDEVWGEVHVEPIALARTISELRRALGDTPKHPSFIETVPKRGYRLIATVEAIETRDRHSRATLGAVAAAALLLVVAAVIRTSDTDPRDGVVASPAAMAAGGADQAAELHRRGREYYERLRYQDNENAIALFEKALSIDGRYVPARADLANAYAMRARARGYDAHWITRAIEEAEAAVAADRRFADAHKALGLAYSTRGWLNRSIEAYERAVTLEPHHGEALNNLASVLWRVGRQDEALQYAIRRARLGQANATAMDNVGDMLFQLGFREEADRWWIRALDLEPNRVATVLDLAYRDLFDGRPDEARSRADALLVVVPSCGACELLRAEIELLAEGGDRNLAAEHLERAFSASPSYFAVRVRLAAHLRDSEPSRAAELLEAVERDASDYVAGGGEWWLAHWALTAVAAVRRDRGETIERFERMIDAGRRNWRFDRRDPLYEWLHDDPALEAALVRMRELVDESRRRVIERDLVRGLPSP